MTLNKVLPTSIVLEIVMVCLHGTTTVWDNYPHNSWIDVIDEVYMSCAPMMLFASVLWVVYLRTHEFSPQARKIRMYQAGFLAVIGGLMLATAFGVRQVDAECYQYRKCEAYELRTIAGLLALFDGFLQLLRPTLPGPRRMSSNSLPTSCPESDIYVIPNDLPAYEPPPAYHELPPELQRPPQEPEALTVNHLPERVV
jgi:hypothetical protein